MGEASEKKPRLLDEFERCGNNKLRQRIENILGWGQPGVSLPSEYCSCLDFLKEKLISRRKPLMYKRFEIGPGGSKAGRKKLVELFLADKDVIKLKEDETPTIEIDHELLDSTLDKEHPITQKVFSCGERIFMLVVERPIWGTPDMVGMFLIKVNSAAGKNWQITKPT